MLFLILYEKQVAKKIPWEKYDKQIISLLISKNWDLQLCQQWQNA